jgi:O-methyltransferase
MNVDVDIYEPTKATLEFFWPLLQENGIMLLDEYDFDRDLEKFPGSKNAVDEFCKAKNISVTKHYTGKSYITKV